MSTGYEYAGRDLPKGEAMATLLDIHVQRQDDLRGFKEFMWSFAWLYLNGCRNFEHLNLSTGTMTSNRLDKDGNLEFQSQRLLSALDRIQGRLGALNVAPAVAPQGESLQGLRERSIGDIILRSATSDMQIRQAYRLFRMYLTTLGCVGVTGHARDLPMIGLTADIEIIHPRELMPFPALGENLSRQCGLVRRRYLPTRSIERMFPGVKLDKDKIRWWEQVIGTQPPEPTTAGPTSPFGGAGNNSVTYMGQSPGGGTGSDSEKLTHGMAQIVELWLDGPRGTCARYVVASGRQIIFDETYEKSPVYCPIGVARAIETGSFWGAGFFDLLFSIHRHSEFLKKMLFNNVNDLNRYGFLVVPNGAFNERTAFAEVGQSLKIVTYEPDAMAGTDFRPFAVTPHNTGDFPGKVAQMADQEMDALNPHRDLVSEKGRIDSAAGLSFLDEQIQQAFTTSTDATNNAYGICYRSLAARLSGMLLTAPRPLPIGRLTLDLAGAVIDPNDLTVHFPSNPLPDISRLSFGIKALTPRSTATRIQQAFQAIEVGMTTPLRVTIWMLEEGIDYPIWMRRWQAPYETIVRNILMLYNDGQSPGLAVTHPHTNDPNLQLEVMDAFMSSPMMSMASEAVQTQFIRFREDLLLDAGRGLFPPGTPTPEGMALQGAMSAQGQPALAQ